MPGVGGRGRLLGGFQHLAHHVCTPRAPLASGRGPAGGESAARLPLLASETWRAAQPPRPRSPRTGSPSPSGSAIPGRTRVSESCFLLGVPVGAREETELGGALQGSPSLGPSAVGSRDSVLIWAGGGGVTVGAWPVLGTRIQGQLGVVGKGRNRGLSDICLLQDLK